MFKRSSFWTGVAVVLAVLTLLVIPPAAMATKGGGGGGGGGEPAADPAIAFRKTFKFNVDKVMVMNADGSNVTVVFDGEGAQIGGRIDWSPDGSKLVFWSDHNGSGIYTYDLANGALTKVCGTMTQFDFACSPVWSPQPVSLDGGVAKYYIAYADQGSSQMNDVYLVEPGENNTPIQLTETPEVYENGITWSASAQKLVFGWATNDYRTGDRFVVYDFAAESGEDPYRVITHEGPFAGKGVGSYHFSNLTEDRLVCTAYGHVWTFTLNDLANPTQLTQTADIEDRWPSWSPDDEKIVFFAADVVGGKWLKNHRFEVISASDGSGRTKIADERTMPVWRRNEQP